MSETDTIVPERHCLNCGQPIVAEFCAHCGQEEKEVRRPFIVFIQEFIWVVFELDGRAYRTVGNLLVRPGFLTRQYFAGRRMRYTPPLRLFLIVSIGFFLIVSLVNSVEGIRQEMTEIATGESAEQPIRDALEEGLTASEDEPANFEGAIDILEQVNLPFLTEEANRNLRTVLITQFEANVDELAENPRDFLTGSLEYVTFFMLLMMPVLALIQQILWILSRRYYVEHLVLTVHNHTFLILMVFIAMLLGLVEEAALPVISEVSGVLSIIAIVWIFVYLYLSLKRYFESGWFVTAVLYLVASLAYSVVLGVGLVGFAILLVLFA